MTATSFDESIIIISYGLNTFKKAIYADMKRIVRSRYGQGSDFETIKEVDTELFYIPSSGDCLWKCLCKAMPGLDRKREEDDDEETPEDKYKEVLHALGVVRDKVAYAKLGRISEEFLHEDGYSLVKFALGQKLYWFGHDEDEFIPIVVSIIDSHYVLLK